MTRAVVFAYHNVGVRCLSVLLAHGVDVPLVVTHRDSPTENIWFASVAALAELHDIPAVTPDDPNTPELWSRIAEVAPDFIFSFYYRHMLRAPLLALARRGAYNLHGSLLPKYRGRVPVNWAIIRSERETGATLHRMVDKPDAGDIVARQAVPILPDDTAQEVFDKVTVAAEIALDGVLPALIAGTAPHKPQVLAQGSYFGGRKPEDGRIDWRANAADIHNLIRAVAPPYPGAFCDLPGGRLQVWRSLRQQGMPARFPAPTLFVDGERVHAQCGDGGILRLVAIAFDGQPADAARLARLLGTSALTLTSDSSRVTS